MNDIDPPQIYVVEQENKFLVFLKKHATPPHQIRRKAKRSADENVAFIRRWQRVAVSNYYSFDNKTSVLI